MATEIRVPSLGESVVEATVGQWFKQAGDAVAADEPLVELETDKVTVEVPAPTSGVLSEISVKAGDTVAVGAVLGAISDGDGKAKPAKAKAEPASSDLAMVEASANRRRARLARAGGGGGGQGARARAVRREEVSVEDMPPSPAARKLLAEAKLDPRRRQRLRPARPGAEAGRARRGRARRQDTARPGAQAQDAAGAPRAGGQGRRLARGAGAHDPAPPDHRQAAQGGARHRRHAHHVQRRGHERGDGAAGRTIATPSRRSTA